MKIQGFASEKPKQDLQQHSYEDSVENKEVSVRITHCGICHSDISLIDNEWGMSSYPFIPGHEIVGKVTEVGDDVNHLELGQRVGIGWQCGSCHHCEWCMQGEQHNCSNQQATCVGRNGGYADNIVVDAKFAIPIPETMSSAETAPMLCGGITVFTPLQRYAGPGDTVAVLGLGGLGHFAVQFADKMGCEVHVLSTSPEKRSEAMDLGASKLVDVRDTDVLDKYQGAYDVIINTVPVGLNWEGYIGMLRPKGKFVQVGGAPKNISASAFSLLSMDKQIVGSHIGSPSMIKRMLAFAADKDIKAVIETFPLEDVNEAVEYARGKPRYRAVLEME